MSEGLLTVSEVSALLHIKPRVLNELARAGKIPCIQVTRKKRLFSQGQVDDYIRRKTTGPKIGDDVHTGEGSRVRRGGAS